MSVEDMARERAAAHGLDSALVCALVEQESGWNPWAIRYEPAFYQRYVQPLVNSGQVKTLTEAAARATSWGLMQVMGQTAREHGFAGRYLSELCDPAVGLEIGCQVLLAELRLAERSGEAGRAAVVRALLLWNGGGRQAYAQEVLDRVEKYERGGAPSVGD